MKHGALTAAAFVLALVAAAGCAPSADATGEDGAGRATLPIGSGFDFYVLSLSWSPSYCEAEGDDANRQQCKAARPYAFVVHGLWPQFERGYPDGLRDGRAGRRQRDAANPLRPDAVGRPDPARMEKARQLLRPFPGRLFFRVARGARGGNDTRRPIERLDDYQTPDPDDVEAAFLEANPGLAPDAVAVSCDRRYLREVRICLTKELGFRACPEVDRRACRRPKVVMPPVRGG